MIPKWSQNDTKMITTLFQNDPTKIPIWPRNDPKRVPKWSESDSKIIPKWSQDEPDMTPRWTQHHPKKTPTWFKHDTQMTHTLSRNNSEIIQNDPKLILKWFQNDLTTIPRIHRPFGRSVRASPRGVPSSRWRKLLAPRPTLRSPISKLWSLTTFPAEPCKNLVPQERVSQRDTFGQFGKLCG